MKRPFALFCALFLSLCALFFYSSVKIKIILLFIAVFLLIIKALLRFVRKDTRNYRTLLAVTACSLIFSSLLCLFFYNKKAEDVLVLADGETHEITAYVTEFNSVTSYSTSCNVKVIKVDGKKTSFSAVLYADFVFDIDTYKEFSTLVTINEIEKEKNGFPLRLYYNAKGFFITLNSYKSDFIEGKKVKTVTSFFKKINSKFDDILEYNLSENGYELISTILLGNRKNLSDGVKRDFGTLGISHLLAVSGIHITIILGFFNFVFSFFGIGGRKKYVLLILLDLMFMGITGFSPSVTRAGIMFLIFCVAEILGYKNDSLNSLFAAVTIICLVSPSSIYDVGLLLSFFATLGIITLGAALRTKTSNADGFIKRSVKNLINSVSTTVSATVFTLPVMWLFFGQVSIVSPITNLIFIPLINLLLVLSPFVIISSKIPFLCNFFSFLVSKISGFTLFISGKASYFRDFRLNLEYDFVPYIFIVFFILFGLAIIFRKKSKLLYLAPIIFFALSFSVCLVFHNNTQKGSVDLLYIREKTNEAFVIKDGGITFIDVSSGGQSNIRTAKNEVAKRLYGLNIDNYMLTHYHKLHISTFNSLCENFYIEKLILPEPVSDSDNEIFITLCESALERGISIIVYEHNESGEVNFKHSNIEIMEYRSIKRSTHPLISFKISANDRTISYFGASSHEADSDFICENTQSDLLIFGAHGPIYKSSFEVSNISKHAYAVYANEEVKGFVECDANGEKILIKDSETFHIKIPAK